jgi:UDP-N-acetylmuramoyl-L-alanyl-D-glutamate--2,6-diaminopimelate ligase
MQIKDIAELFIKSSIIGEPTTVFKGIQSDSRKVTLGDLFICVTGLTVDGHRYAEQAVKQGASALVVERKLELDIPQLIVSDTRYAMAWISAHYYGYPSQAMKVIGVTGTNGKTSTVWIIEKILEQRGYRTALMGNLGVKIGPDWHKVELNTQESIDLHRYFHLMKQAETDYCVMEVSSMGLEMGRVRGVHFRTGVFTNLTQDHLDNHLTMDNYRAAKGLLFSRMGNEFAEEPGKRQYVVLNADDSASEYYRGLTNSQMITYGIVNQADVMAHDIRVTSAGTEFAVNTWLGAASIRMKLVGRFNVYNMLAAIAALLAEGESLSNLGNSIERVPTVDGRMELVDEGQSFLTLVDYAHTPDGLENALSTVREFAKGRVITVFGCGGDRDRTKRPVMGGIAARYSDYVICTSDNPRTEDPEAILQDIEPGIRSGGKSSGEFALIADRQTAIQKAVEMAAPEDVVLIAGKGHETYQIIGKVMHDFDDREVAREAIRRRKP